MKINQRLCAAVAAIALAGLPVAASARHHSHHDQAGSAQGGGQAGVFDYYLLSLSIAPNFCALSPGNQAKTECRTLTDAQFQQTPLTVHGLWPNRASVSVNRQPQRCAGPALGDFPDDLRVQLQRYMPGGPGLARHEWERHGACSGLAPDVYFRTMVRLAQAANSSIGAVMHDKSLLGHTTRVDELLADVAVGNPALAPAIVVSCRFPRGGGGGNGALIEEIRIVLSKDFKPMPVGNVGLRQSSGCPNGAGFLPA